jgi:hypothetical protein
MKTYPALFAAIGGRDGMDAGGAHWMTCAIYRTCLGARGCIVHWVIGHIGLILSLQYIYVSVATIDQNIFKFFLCIKGDVEWMEIYVIPIFGASALSYLR